RRRGGMEARKDVGPRRDVDRVDGRGDERPERGALEAVTEAIREMEVWTESGHDEIREMRETEDPDDAERDLGELASRAAGEERGQHVRREEREVAEIEEREPLRGRRRDEAIEGLRRLDPEHREVERVESSVHRRAARGRQEPL